jgi:hypothetical protein
MQDPERPNHPDKNLIKIDPGTLLAIVIAFLFLPLLFAGLFNH